MQSDNPYSPFILYLYLRSILELENQPLILKYHYFINNCNPQFLIKIRQQFLTIRNFKHKSADQISL